MASGRIVDYLGYGTAAARPASLSLTTGAIGIYYATDTSALSVWDGTAWVAPTLSGSVAWGAITGTLSSQTDLVSSLLVAQSELVGINAQTGTTYTLVLADAGKDIQVTNAAAITVTIPPNSSVAFAINTCICISQWGAGTITIAAGAGVTLVDAFGATTSAQYDGRVIQKVATDTWRIW